jgi:hypothetical protein
MTQTQKTIPIEFENGTTGEATATGNNAAWLCCCDYTRPLIGRSGLYGRITVGLKISCPECDRHYFVVPDGGDYKAAVKVIEVPR